VQFFELASFPMGAKPQKGCVGDLAGTLSFDADRGADFLVS
jgi:hypothetical protein